MPKQYRENCTLCTMAKPLEFKFRLLEINPIFHLSKTIYFLFCTILALNIEQISPTSPKKIPKSREKKSFYFHSKIHNSIVLKFNHFMLQICLNTLNNKTFIQFLHQIQLNRIPSISIIQTQTLSTPKTQ